MPCSVIPEQVTEACLLNPETMKEDLL